MNALASEAGRLFSLCLSSSKIGEQTPLDYLELLHRLMDLHVLQRSQSYLRKQESSPIMFSRNNHKNVGEIYNSVLGPTGCYRPVDQDFSGVVVVHPDGFTTTPASDAERNQRPFLKKLGEYSTGRLNGNWTA
jgi:hypothetical protein